MPEDSTIDGADENSDSDGTPAASTTRRQSAVRILGAGLLIVALFVVVFTRLELARTKSYLEHDEVIGILAATGNATPFLTARVELSNRWVPASTWQSYLKIKRPFDLISVERGLSKSDVAPPLYFWLLHIWLLVFGSTTTTPMLLSIPISIALAVAIVGLVRKVTGNVALGAAAALGWALTVPAWTLSGMARPYDLLALFSVLIVWQALRFLDKDASRVWDTVLLGLLFAAGMLTQYFFAITAVSIVIVILLAAVLRKESYLAGRLAIALGGAMVLFFSLNPGWYQALLNGQKRFSSPRTAVALGQRISAVIRTFAPVSGFDKQAKVWALSVRRFAPAFHLRYVAVIVIVLLAGLLVLAVVRRDQPSRFSFQAGATVFAALWTSGLTVLLYLGFVSPPWAMCDRYMAAAWALGAPATVVCLSVLPKRFVSFAVAAWVLLMFWATIQPISRIAVAPTPTLGDVSGVGHVVIDAKPRGFVTRYLLAVPSTAEVFVASQPELVAFPGLWLPSIQPGDLYVHIPGGSGPSPPPISDALEGHFILEPIPGVTVKRFAEASQGTTVSP